MKKILALSALLLLFNLGAKSQCDATFTYTFITCDSVWFVPASSGSQYDYYWDFGDGDTSTDPSPAHTFSANGTYAVYLYIVDSIAGCSDILTIPVTINCPSCNIYGIVNSVPDSASCDVYFYSAVTGGTPPYTYFWNFGDGNTSTSANPVNTYPGSGTWTASLTVTDFNGCDTTIYDVVTTNCTSSCNAQFTYTYVACDSVWFYPVSMGSQYDYWWDFGDGEFSTNASPSHQYDADGTYYVVLYLTDSIAGCTDILTVPVTINCGTTSCTTDGAVSWYPDSTSCDIYFVSTAFGGTAPYTYYWQFGDGNTSTSANPVNTYPGTGTWTASLTITDDNGCDTTIYTVVDVNCSATPCDAQFTYTYISCDSVWFYPVSMGSNYDYWWDFGDGEFSTEATPAHQYDADGTYYVVLYLTDSIAGCTDILTVPITINCGSSPCTTVADFSWWIDTTTCEVNFVSTAFGGTAPYTYYWQFGDGNTSTNANPSHIYASSGTYTVLLTVTDNNGCDTSVYAAVDVMCNPSPCNANFTYTYVACDSVWFIPVSQGSQYDYYWDFGDGSFSTQQSPAHQFAGNGTYLVYLYLTDSTQGCADILTISVTINCGASPCYINGAFSWWVDTITCEVNFVSTAYGGTSPYTYYWNFGDGNTSSEAHPIHQYPNNSTWTPTLTITDSMGCDTTLYNVVDVSCSGFNSVEDEVTSTLNVYPNPGTGQYTVELPSNSFIMIYDLAGNIVHEDHCNVGCNNYQLDITHLNSGTYILSVNNGVTIESLKLIKY